MTYKIWFENELVDRQAALVSVLSPTAQYGLNVFEGIRCYWNDDTRRLYIFRLDDHIDRLYDSMKLIGIRIRYTKEQLRDLILFTVEANTIKEDISVRLIAYVGGMGSWSSTETADILISPFPTPRRNINDLKCLSACVVNWERISDRSMPPRIKLGANYMNSRLGYLESRNKGFDTPIFLNSNGHVSEGSGACLFMLRSNKFYTPATTSSILESITRNTIMTMMEKMGILIKERDIDKTELYLADEIFLCGTAAEITPITSVDWHLIGNGSAGKKTLALLDAYHKVVTSSSEIIDVNEFQWLEVIR
jgi:branched-chain amino acid aminotransferase